MTRFERAIADSKPTALDQLSYICIHALGFGPRIIGFKPIALDQTKLCVLVHNYISITLNVFVK